MDCSHCIGRVGALAVALGVGVAIATTPAIGYAAPGTSGSTETDSGAGPDTSITTGDSAQPDNDAPTTETDAPAATSEDEDGADTLTGDAEVIDDSEVIDDGGVIEDDVSLPARDRDSADTDDTDTSIADLDVDASRGAAAPEDDSLQSLFDAGVADELPAPTRKSAGSAPSAAAAISARITTARAAGTSVPAPAPAIGKSVETLIGVAADLATTVFAPLLAPGGGGWSPALWALAAVSRREIGDVGPALTTVLPGTANLLAAADVNGPGEEPSLPEITEPTSWLSEIGDFIRDADEWLNTYVNFEPWINGRVWLPAALRPLFFHAEPDARSMQLRLDLQNGESSGPIRFRAEDQDSSTLIFSVPERGLPGAPKYGTVTVDNAAGTFTYTADADFVGETDTFSFVVSDATSPHVHAWDNLINGPFGLFNTSLDGGHSDTATVTIFNGIPTTTDITGEFSVLTYNITDLPFPLSGPVWPRFKETLDIGSRINDFDIVNIQEDVAYHPFLVSNADFPDETAPKVPTWLYPIGAPFSDGLNSFSAYDINSLSRQAWQTKGSFGDPRGFTYSRMAIPGGSSIDVYNVNTSGGSLNDDNITQLSDFITANSKGRAVIVAGDFNVLSSPALTNLVSANKLIDARGQNDEDLPSKVFYRDADPFPADLPNAPLTTPVDLTVEAYRDESEKFEGLADSVPLSVKFSYTVDSVGPQNVDLANWMTDLGPEFANLPLTQLPIPGTHDSGSYGISPKSDWALTGKSDFGFLTELPPIIQELIVKPIAAGWGKTQGDNLYDQFSQGIRYVDLRLSNEPDGTIYIEHGLRGPKVDVVIADIERFAEEHPNEVLIIQPGRFINFTAETHEEFLADLRAAIGDRMISRDDIGTDSTLQDIWDLPEKNGTKPNVIVVYGDDQIVDQNTDLWYGNNFWGPWPNVPTMAKNLPAQEKNLKDRPPGTIWNLSGAPTPDTGTIVAGILTLGPSSNEAYTWDVHPPLQQWLRVNFKESVNMVTVDWPDAFWPEGSSYSREVIAAVYETLTTRT